MPVRLCLAVLAISALLGAAKAGPPSPKAGKPAPPAKATPAAAPATADAIAQRFFGAVRSHDYKAAYDLLSPGVRRDLPFGEFSRRSKDIIGLQVLELEAVERGRHLVRYRVKGKLRIVYQGDLFEAVYAGTANMSLSGADWRIVQVELKPVTQKRLGKAPPDYRI